MNNSRVPTPIVDKNGKHTTVHKNDNLKPNFSRLAPLSVLPPVRSVEHLYPSNLTYDEIVSEWSNFKLEKKRWTKYEHSAKTVLDSVLGFVETPNATAKSIIKPSEETFHQVRDYLTGMHFMKEMLSKDELTMLWYAESIITKIDNESESGFVY